MDPENLWQGLFDPTTIASYENTVVTSLYKIYGRSEYNRLRDVKIHEHITIVTIPVPGLAEPEAVTITWQKLAFQDWSDASASLQSWAISSLLFRGLEAGLNIVCFPLQLLYNAY